MLAIKAYIGKSKFNLAKHASTGGIEPGTSYDLLWCLPDWANLVSVNWGMFNFTFLGASIDFGTYMT